MLTETGTYSLETFLCELSPSLGYSLEALSSFDKGFKIKEMFDSLNIPAVTANNAKNIIAFCRSYELRKGNVEALNSPYIGLSKMYYLPKDQDIPFEEFGISRNDLTAAMKKCKAIDFNHKVTSNPFNLFVIWLVHCFINSKQVPANLSHEVQMALLKLLHYRFFTSRVNHLFPHGTNEEIAVATVERLSGKFDIKKPETATWKLVMEARSRDVLDPSSIHYKSLKAFGPDYQILYVISDINTRLRNKLSLITDTYYDTKEHNERVKHYGISDEIDGEQVLKSVEAIYEQMVLGLSSDFLSVDSLLDAQKIKIVCGFNKNVNPALMRSLLIKFSDKAVNQYRHGKSKSIKTVKGSSVAEGYLALIQEIVTVTYAAVLRNKDVNVKSKLSILEKTQHIYKASRISDQALLDVKTSVAYWVDEARLTSREETKGALRIAFITYIILKSFDYM